MTIEKISSPEENQEAAKPLQASSDQPPDQKQCSHDGDCPEGYVCVNGVCQPG
jgi:hypothetical protein